MEEEPLRKLEESFRRSLPSTAQMALTPSCGRFSVHKYVNEAGDVVGSCLRTNLPVQMYLTTVAKVLDAEVPLTDMSYIVRSRTYTENVAYTRESE
eukprot:810497-Rhodomonas_salina.1